jgi:hypothetical protein
MSTDTFSSLIKGTSSAKQQAGKGFITSEKYVSERFSVYAFESRCPIADSQI